MDDMKKVTVKSIDDDKVVLGGYAAIWGNETDRDLENEYFTKQTDFWLDKWTGPRPVLYDHGHHPKVQKSVLGFAVKFVPDDIGLSIEAELDRHRQYVNEVVELAKQGVLGWSSGAVAHLTERMGGEIKTWAIAEMTVTPTPAEPRLLDLPILKMLLNDAGLEIPEGIIEGDDANKAEPIDADELKTDADDKFNVQPESIAAAVSAFLELEAARRRNIQ